LNKTAASPAVVTLSSNKAVLGVAGSVTVSAGQSSANFTVTSGTIVGSQTAVITASFSGSSLPVTLMVTAPVPTADSVTPSGGAGVSQTFSFVFSDSQSATNLTTAAILIAPTLAYPNTCFVIYDRIHGTIQLQWDNAMGAQSKQLASTSVLQNSQCSIGATSVTASPLSIAVSIDITFRGVFSGLKNIYLYGADGDGSINTGWVQRGTYSVNTVAPPLPSVDSVSPSGGAGTSQTFSFVFSDSQNINNLSAAAILIAPSLTAANSCFVIYDRNRGTVQLEWDNVTGAASKLITATTKLENSQCSIGATSATTSALSLTISIDITFKSAFSGLKNIYMYAADTDGSINTGWVQKGTYSVTGGAPVPTADSVTPSGGAGPVQTFSFVFSDSQSAANLSAAAILFAPSLTYPNSCFLIYDRNRGTIQLEWDNMTGADAKPIDSTLTLENSQCRIGTTALNTSGLSNTITVNITFKSAFPGLKNIYLYGADTDGTINTGWVQKGTWTSF